MSIFDNPEQGNLGQGILVQETGALELETTYLTHKVVANLCLVFVGRCYTLLAGSK